MSRRRPTIPDDFERSAPPPSRQPRPPMPDRESIPAEANPPATDIPRTPMPERETPPPSPSEPESPNSDD